MNDEGDVALDIGRKLVERACRFDDSEQEIDSLLIPNNLGVIEPLANQAVAAERESLQNQVRSQAAEQVDREVARLEVYFDYRERAAQDKVEATRATLNHIRESGDESQRQILPAWEANLRRDEALPQKLAEDRRRRIEEAEKYRLSPVAWSLKSLGRIEVVAVS